MIIKLYAKEYDLCITPERQSHDLLPLGKRQLADNLWKFGSIYTLYSYHKKRLRTWHTN